MSMWQKKGLIYNVKGEHEWNTSHAQVPVVDVLENRLRIYYATRNPQGKSNVSFIEVDKKDPSVILYQHPTPLLSHGEPGTFDDSGIMPSCIIQAGNRKFLYYVGWTTRQTVPYQNAVGLAVSTDGGINFTKISAGPVISINHIEPYFSGTSFVLFENGIYKMWYLSCTGWEKQADRLEPSYHIKYAESGDGINWKQTGRVAVDLEAGEGGLVSATVLKEAGIYKMWYGRRKKSDYRTEVKNSYRIGYAESADGVNWIRKDEQAGIDLSGAGWDSEMISYPCVVQNKDELMLFYNGNGFGKTGFGYAVMKKN